MNFRSVLCLLNYYRSTLYNIWGEYHDVKVRNVVHVRIHLMELEIIPLCHCAVAALQVPC